MRRTAFLPFALAAATAAATTVLAGAGCATDIAGTGDTCESGDLRACEAADPDTLDEAATYYVVYFYSTDRALVEQQRDALSNLGLYVRIVEGKETASGPNYVVVDSGCALAPLSALNRLVELNDRYPELFLTPGAEPFMTRAPHDAPACQQPPYFVILFDGVSETDASQHLAGIQALDPAFEDAAVRNDKVVQGSCPIPERSALDLSSYAQAQYGLSGDLYQPVAGAGWSYWQHQGCPQL